MALREQLKRWSQGPWAYPVAGTIGFLEGSFLIVAVEPLLIPMFASRKRTIWLLALMPVVGNIFAGLLMYALGAFLNGPVIEPLVSWMGAETDYENALQNLKDNGFVTLLLVGVTPFPFQVGTAAAGAAGYSLALFVLAVALSRGLRYLALAAFVKVLGDRAREWIDRRQLEIFVAGLALFVVIGAFAFLA